MKVYIGPYKNYFGPYQLAETLCFWTKNKDEYGSRQYPDWVHNFGKKICNTWVGDLLNKIHEKNTRNVKIKIHNYDTWNMDSTLAMIILPMLKQLKETKHGAGNVDDCDVPAELASTNAELVEEGDIDANWFKRADWLFDELIWTFEQIQPDNDDEFQFFHNPDGSHKPYDVEGHKAYQARISKGLALFGKYYQMLWD